MTPEAVAWLREQIQARLEAARKADTGEPWEAERHYGALWMADLKPSAGPVDIRGNPSPSLGIEDCEPYEDPRFLPAMIWHAEHIAANDPQQAIADCRMQLAIVDRCMSILEAFADPENGLWPDVTRRERSHARAHLADVADAYRHQPDYEEHWGSGE